MLQARTTFITSEHWQLSWPRATASSSVHPAIQCRFGITVEVKESCRSECSTNASCTAKPASQPSNHERPPDGALALLGVAGRGWSVHVQHDSFLPDMPVNDEDRSPPRRSAAGAESAGAKLSNNPRSATEFPLAHPSAYRSTASGGATCTCAAMRAGSETPESSCPARVRFAVADLLDKSRLRRINGYLGLRDAAESVGVAAVLLRSEFHVKRCLIPPRQINVEGFRLVLAFGQFHWTAT